MKLWIATSLSVRATQPGLHCAVPATKMIAMDETAQQPDAPRKLRRRWFVFSLRSMMVVVTVLCVWFGVISYRAKGQKEAVAAIRSSGPLAFVTYDYEVAEGPPPGPTWLRNAIGVDYLANAVRVFLFQADDDTIALLDHLPHLEHLSLDGRNVTDAALGHVEGLKQLNTLYIGATTEITDAGLKHLEGLHHLKCVDLRGNVHIGDAGLDELTRLSGLEQLDLEDCTRISDAGLKNLPKLTHLASLNLFICRGITDSGLKYLHGMAQLRRLNVQGTSVTRHGIEEIKRSIPNLQIVESNSGQPARLR